MIKWEKTEYIDIETGEILSYNEIKEKGLILQIIKEEITKKIIENGKWKHTGGKSLQTSESNRGIWETERNDRAEYRKCIKYVKIRAEQLKLW